MRGRVCVRAAPCGGPLRYFRRFQRRVAEPHADSAPSSVFIQNAFTATKTRKHAESYAVHKIALRPKTAQLVSCCPIRSPGRSRCHIRVRLFWRQGPPRGAESQLIMRKRIVVSYAGLQARTHTHAHTEGFCLCLFHIRVTVISSYIDNNLHSKIDMLQC